MTPSTTPHTDRTVRILIADGDADTRALYQQSLSFEGWDVIDAADGRDALVSALVHRPSLVITDTRLPFFDGYALCQVLRQDSQTRHVPILVVTAEFSELELDRARAAGADAILVKPVLPDMLHAEVQRLLNRNAEPKGKSTANTGAVLTAPVPRPPPLRARREATAHRRVETTAPPTAPPTLRCPACDRPLVYLHSNVGGIRSAPEQWDAYTCPSSCGTFEFRHRTRRTRRVG